MTPIPLTAEAGRFIATLRYADLPPEAIEVARLGFADTVAVIMAGQGEAVTEVISAYAAASLGAGKVPWLLGQGQGCAEAAALVNATAAHALDFDDYAFSNHISAVLVPVALACAEIAPDGSGERMVSAYVAGYEVWADLMTREPDHLHSKGWHPTAVFGPVAAAATAAHLLGLDAAAATNALALAASHSGGLMANFGSMTKPYHAGLAAEAGIRAARLTQAGMTAQAVALESPVGLLGALSPDRRVDLSRPARFGDLWRIAKARINIKKYPTVGASQRSIDAILALQAERDLAPLREQITEIVPRVSILHAAVMRFDDPKVPAEAKFSLQYACAAAVLWGRLGLAELTPEKLADPALRALMAKVRVNAVDESDPDYPVAAPWDQVTLHLADGSIILTPQIRRATGHADAPLTSAQHWAKFLDCAGQAGIATSEARRLFDACGRIETLGGPEALKTTRG